MPGSSKAEGEGINMNLYVDYCYLLLGMGVVAMNFYLLKEDVLIKSKRLKQKLAVLFYKLKS